MINIALINNFPDLTTTQCACGSTLMCPISLSHYDTPVRVRGSLVWSLRAPELPGYCCSHILTKTNPGSRGEDTGVHLRMERETQDLWPQNGEGAYRVTGASELEEVCSMYKTLWPYTAIVNSI